MVIKLIQSSQTMIKAVDPYVVAVYEQFNKAIMNVQSHLNDDKIKLILTYIDEET